MNVFLKFRGLNYNSGDNSSHTIFIDVMWSRIPLEIQMSLLRMTLQMKISPKEKINLRVQELEILDEKWLQTQQILKLYRSRMTVAFNKKVKQCVFKQGDLVLAVKRPMIHKKV